TFPIRQLPDLGAASGEFVATLWTRRRALRQRVLAPGYCDVLPSGSAPKPIRDGMVILKCSFECWR
ncbi:hypothetical protein, partial [Paraburkholderia bengalensis]|uniref:hypothetical protein n=1 Tax=Paraburkholderia bengalensis TaxID=2747562 RepID=UPI0030149E84